MSKKLREQLKVQAETEKTALDQLKKHDLDKKRNEFLYSRSRQERRDPRRSRSRDRSPPQDSNKDTNQPLKHLGLNQHGAES